MPNVKHALDLQQAVVVGNTPQKFHAEIVRELSRMKRAVDAAISASTISVITRSLCAISAANSPSHSLCIRMAARAASIAESLASVSACRQAKRLAGLPGLEPPMPPTSIEFDAPDLAARMEKLSPAELDAVPFGVIELDANDIVLVYNANEVSRSGYGSTPLGKNFFEVSRNPNKRELQSRIIRAKEEDPVDLEFGWRGGTGAAERELRLRVMSASRGGVWIFVERD